MFKFSTAVCLIGLLLTSMNSYAFTISSKTEMANGIRTQLCINGECKVFEGAISATISEKPQTAENYLIEVSYLNKIVKLFDWNKNLFME